nr:replication protein A 70 kDa DNA-binding subunit B-like [Ipomoea batatas]
MTYQNDIELLDERLKLYSTYIVSNAVVSRANEFFNIPNERYRFVWSINRKTLMQDVDNDDQLDLQPSSNMDTKPFGQLYAYKSKRQAIHIIGVVISKLPREFIVTNMTRQQKTNDFVMVDKDDLQAPGPSKKLQYSKQLEEYSSRNEWTKFQSIGQSLKGIKEEGFNSRRSSREGRPLAMHLQLEF